MNIKIENPNDFTYEKIQIPKLLYVIKMVLLCLNYGLKKIK